MNEIEPNDVGIDVEPPEIKFSDVHQGELYVATIKITNCDKVQKRLRLQGPLTKNFDLEVKNPDIPQAPGLGFTAKVKFYADKVENLSDRLILLVDSYVFEIPLFACAPSTWLSVQSCVDFGMVVSYSHFLSRELVVINNGSKAGQYEISYKGSKQIQISPQTGTLQPKKLVKAEVKLFTGTPGVVNEIVTVNLEGGPEEKVTIRANIVEQALKILHLDNPDVAQRHVQFGPVYYGTDLIEPAWIYNDGPEHVKWVAILDEGCEGEEAGTDLTLTTASILASQTTSAMRGRAYDVLGSLVTVFPNQGDLRPYERAPIYFRFSPRFNRAAIGWESTEEPPPRQDFALFMSFEIVGSMNSFTDRSGDASRKFEVGITATALPVILNILPQDTLNFGELESGQQRSIVCTLHNESAILPLHLNFKKIAQFNVVPKRAYIKPGQKKDFVVSFQPNQYGNFRKIQLVEVFGRVFTDEDDSSSYENSSFVYQTFQTIPIQLLGVSSIGPVKDRRSSDSKKLVERKRNGVIVVGIDDRACSIRPSERDKKYETYFTRQPRVNYVDPDYARTKKEDIEKIANDNKYINVVRASWLKHMKQLETKEHLRHDNEIDLGIKPGKGIRPRKLKADDIDVQREVEQGLEPPIRGQKRLLNTQDLAVEEAATKCHASIEGLNAVPITKEEKRDCNKRLSPKELFNVVVGPPLIDFGEVCTRSTNRKQINILNNLNQSVSFEINIKFKELRQTSPLSQVIPPKSHANLTLVFESTCEGQFDRSLEYTINSQHQSHLLVKATVVPVQLRLSTQLLEISPEPGAPVDLAFRSTVTLHNSRNYPAEFTWSPILGEKGTAFSIRPASGVVDAFKSLRCEVVFHQSYFAPLEGDFLLKVRDGTNRKLSCIARLGTSGVKFQEKKMAFGNVALNLPTTRTAVLQNMGAHTAMFCVSNSNPIADMEISPHHGIIPVGGSTELKINFEPKTLIKYDAFIQVMIRGWKSLEMRLNGVVDEPRVDINLSSFKFHGVFCGSQHTIPFKMVNKAHTMVQVRVDMSSYEDFTFSHEKDELADEKMHMSVIGIPDLHCFTIPPKSSLSCSLKFHPTSVAGYDFILPVIINKTRAPSPSPSIDPLTPVPTEQTASQKRKMSLQHHIVTPKRRVQATALREPLTLSDTEFKFSLPVSYMEMSVPDNAGGDRKVVIFENQSNQVVKWKLALSAVKGLSSRSTSFVFLKQGGAEFPHNKVAGEIAPHEKYTFTIVFCPRKVGSYYCEIPLFINDDHSRPYKKIVLDAFMVQSKIKFDPPVLSLNPVPLSTNASGVFRIIATGFFRLNCLRVEMVKSSNDENYDIDQHFRVQFPNGLQINPTSCSETSDITRTVLQAVVTFSSDVPFSKSITLVFTDDSDRKFSMDVSATAENCLLSTYPFLAQSSGRYKIVCEGNSYVNSQDSDGEQIVRTTAAEAVMVHLESDEGSSRFSGGSAASSATTSRFCASSSSYEESTINTDDGSSRTESMMSPSTTTTSKEDSSGSSENAKNPSPFASDSKAFSRSVGSLMFPYGNRAEKAFHLEVVRAVESWYSAFGWPSPFSFKIPENIRKLVSRYVFRPDEHQNSNLSNSKTLYDMIVYLSGRQLPGVPMNQALPTDTRERVTQLYWQHSTLITFIRSQGGSMSGVRPEYLLTPEDYRSWLRMKVFDKNKGDTKRNSDESEHVPLEPSESDASFSDGSIAPVEQTSAPVVLKEDVFELVSKHAWTVLLLQVYKVLILSRVTHEQFRQMKPPMKGHPFPAISCEPTASNIYSTSERIILSWLNYNFDNVRTTLWKESVSPPSRWVVNFDLDLLDGLVLAASLAAYCPWLKEEYFSDIYTLPNTPEQCLHNTLLVIKAMKSIGLNYHILATDITDPNPITMLLFCVYLYQHLPAYLPKTKIEFVGGLSSATKRKVVVQNPAGKAMKYICKICGRDSGDFNVASGREVFVPSRGSCSVEVVFKSRLLRPAEAYLVLVSRYEFPTGDASLERKTDMSLGSTLVFELSTIVSDIEPIKVITATSPCYELTQVPLIVTNPFHKAGEFKIIVSEPKINAPPEKPEKGKSSPKKSSKQNKQQIANLLSPDIKEQINRGFSVDNGRPQNEISSFYCKQPSVRIEAGGKETVMLDYLPFNMGKDFCTVLLLNEQVGEMVYAVEGVASLPLPSPLYLNMNSPHSADMDEETKKMRDWKENVLYWKCPLNTTLYETLRIPVTNPSKERALRLAARQRMSQVELKRRCLTGTLQSGQVAAAIALQGKSCGSKFPPYKTLYSKTFSTVYKVHTNTKWFETPSTVTGSAPLSCGPTPASELQKSNTGPNSIQPDGTFDLDLKFTSEKPGLYPCEIILQSANDVRLYRIECVVHPSGSNASFDFSTPANQALTQNIPIQNATNHDWNLECHIDGKSFRGPRSLVVRAQETVPYPLTFHPNCECVVEGHLVISNKADGLEHNFELHGVGETSLAIDNLKMRCKCRGVITRTVKVPNFSPGTLKYGVYSDLPFLEGENTVIVPKGRTTDYTFTLSPQQRGDIKGVLMFVADHVDSDPVGADSDDDSDLDSSAESDVDKAAAERIRPVTPSFAQPIGSPEDAKDGQKVWFSLKIEVEPSDPVMVVDIECPAQHSITKDISVTNPTSEEITFNVSILGDNLSTQSSLRIFPGVPGKLPITFNPIELGTFEGSVVFDSPSTGEFWYKIIATGVTPPPQSLPTMEAALGSMQRQTITLRNMSDEMMVVEVLLDHNENFSFDLCYGEDTGNQEARVRPNSSTDVLLQFTPTSLGLHKHKAKFTFRSRQLGDVEYYVTGRGFAPSLMEPMSISASMGASTNLNLPFRNPTDVPVLVDFKLIENDETLNSVSTSVIRRNIKQEPGFLLLTKQQANIELLPHAAFEIPFAFSPTMMMKYQATVSVSLRRKDGKFWPNEFEENELDLKIKRKEAEDLTRLRPMSRDERGNIVAIRWVYPVHGIPTVKTITDGDEAVLECQARSRIEERIEVSLTGAVPSLAESRSLIRLRGAPRSFEDQTASGTKLRKNSKGIDGLSLNEEFHFEFFYSSDESKKNIEKTMSVELIRKDRNPSNGIVVLIFKCIFAPFCTMNSVVQLNVTSVSGGTWSFPLRIRATEPPPDDSIEIVSDMVGQPSQVSFTLHSQVGYPTPFEAYFAAKSDPEFEVTPTGGELQPDGSEGTRFDVTFTPTRYGRTFHALLIVKAIDMQWSYDLVGTFPKYKPPEVRAKIDFTPPTSHRLKQKRRVNFLQQNLRLLSTSASSPIKGKRIMSGF